MNLLPFSIILLTALTIGFPMASKAAKPAKPPPACTTEQHRAFDFWIGEWDVTAKGKDKPHARSSITLANDGCSIHEHYVTQSGYTGNSLNFYNAGSKKWHQTWIDNQGSPLYLDGNFEKGSMVLTDGSNRITWSKKNKTVNQVWETTKDQGKTWTVIFDGNYKNIAP